MAWATESRDAVPVLVTVPDGRSTFTALTPGTDPTAACTVDTQCPHVIPRTLNVVTLIAFHLSCM